MDTIYKGDYLFEATTSHSYEIKKWNSQKNSYELLGVYIVNTDDFDVHKQVKLFEKLVEFYEELENPL